MKSKRLNSGIAFLSTLFFSLAAYAHDGDHSGGGGSGSVAAGLDEFPNLHPLVVHFAIVLILVGAVLQLANVYFMKREVSWIAFVTTAVGFVAAYLAAGPYHPHAHELSEHAKQVLDQHDQWADWTLWLGGVGAALQGLNLFFLTDKRWALGLVAAVLLGAGYAVSQAGHFGSQLVYIEGVGPQGQYLEPEGDGHNH
ncbi:hypothetical protein [Persicitalea sp.]|uniref:hypothetical protein n=1 Tax=Persicitalea sp. TaxID=3100273 RepID=UPI003593050B